MWFLPRRKVGSAGPGQPEDKRAEGTFSEAVS